VASLDGSSLSTQQNIFAAQDVGLGRRAGLKQQQHKSLVQTTKGWEE